MLQKFVEQLPPARRKVMERAKTELRRLLGSRPDF
jgi:hypothetical protein